MLYIRWPGSVIVKHQQQSQQTEELYHHCKEDGWLYIRLYWPSQFKATCLAFVGGSVSMSNQATLYSMLNKRSIKFYWIPCNQRVPFIQFPMVLSLLFISFFSFELLLCILLNTHSIHGTFDSIYLPLASFLSLPFQVPAHSIPRNPTPRAPISLYMHILSRSIRIFHTFSHCFFSVFVLSSEKNT